MTLLYKCIKRFVIQTKGNDNFESVEYNSELCFRLIKKSIQGLKQFESKVETQLEIFILKKCEREEYKNTFDNE